MAENLFLRKQLALYLERQVKPRRANDATGLSMVLVSRLFSLEGGSSQLQAENFPLLAPAGVPPVVERWFAELANKQLRRGAHRSVPQLKAAIQEFIDAHQADPKPFVWTKTADEILASIARFAQRTFSSVASAVWRGRWMPLRTPRAKKRTALLRKLKLIFRGYRSQPVKELIEQINPILRGWVKYFAVGHSSRCFAYIRDWVEQKIRGHLARASQRQGFGWQRWRKEWLYGPLGLFHEYRVVYQLPSWTAVPTRSAP